jgi:hypothetical protein
MTMSKSLLAAGLLLTIFNPVTTGLPEGADAHRESIVRAVDYCRQKTESRALFDGKVVRHDGGALFEDCMRRQGYGPKAHSGEAWQEVEE